MAWWLARSSKPLGGALGGSGGFDSHTFRHTFAAMRLQTMDNGQPVSPYTVMRELGHSSIGLIEKTYGHYSNVRHRAPVVEYREAEVVDLNSRKQA